jgi:aspartyl-tRNA(Asn)/glutamyl-tRNA(Gln) amidotransferase subunit A
MTTEVPWQGDACSLVDAYRRGERSPTEELEATLAAIDESALNAFGHLDPDAARAAAARADVSQPFGGVPIGVKELDRVAGWPYHHASVPLQGETSDVDSTMVTRLRAAGAVLVGQTTASEFGGINCTRTHVHGVTSNPWDLARTPGGSSGGTAAAVAGGLVTLGTAGDGGGSIRIPAGFTGLFGLKGTTGRIPLGPKMTYGNLTVVIGCLSRSVRDTARWFDLCNGFDPRDPLSLPATGGGWEAGIGHHHHELRGLRTAVVEDWGGATCSPAMWEHLEAQASSLVADAGLVRVDGVDITLPKMGTAWALSGALGNYALLEGHWPDCAGELTPEIRAGLRRADERYGIEARIRIERRRTELNEAMARIFDEVDLVISASNPDVAFAAEGPMPAVFGGVEAGIGNNGLLTFPANLYGCPAVSIPAGSVEGLPVGLQVVGRHFTEPQLLELAAIVERERPWPLVAPASPR